MALGNADRCSDLDRDYLKWIPSGVQFTVVQLTKTRTSYWFSITHHYQMMMKHA